jgi:formate hydrogenlyase subunit 6/NADH:ubiquinone oxidoreductase subunit I
MTKTVLCSLFSKPSTVRYPFEKKQVYKNTRGSIAIDIEKCIFCGICSKKCPTGAIAVNKEAKKWEINRTRCIACNYCVEVCPKKCLNNENAYTSPFTSKEKNGMTDSSVQTPKAPTPPAENK